MTPTLARDAKRHYVMRDNRLTSFAPDGRRSSDEHIVAGARGAVHTPARGGLLTSTVPDRLHGPQTSPKNSYGTRPLRVLAARTTPASYAVLVEPEVGHSAPDLCPRAHDGCQYRLPRHPHPRLRQARAPTPHLLYVPHTHPFHRVN